MTEDDASTKAVANGAFAGMHKPPYVRKEVIGDCTLYLGDCREVLPAISGWDAVVTDPPYGIGMDGGKVGKSEYVKKGWDTEAPDVSWVFTAPQAVVWGGNYFPCPPQQKWLVWDKRNDVTTFADCELAWTNLEGAVRVFRWLWSGPYQQQREERFHPTQKPLELMKWCVDFTNGTVLDPYMGSGTTGVACQKRGRKFIGIERDSDYFDVACKRIQAAYEQPDLLTMPEEPVMEQTALALE